MVYCTYCGHSFSRDEHLERHILTHTNIKPYKCPECHMSFARRDLLQRHYGIHGRDKNNEPGLPPQDIIPKSAGRTPIACHNCAKTKTKCDKKVPCTRCESRKLTCTSRPARRTQKAVARSAGPPVSNDSAAGAGNTHPSAKTETGAKPTWNEESPARDVPVSQANGLQLPGSQVAAQSPSQSPPVGVAHARKQSASTSSRNPSASLSATSVSDSPHEEQSLHVTLSQPSSFFDHSAQNSISTAQPLQSPMMTDMYGMAGMVTQTPMAGYDGFLRTAINEINPGQFAVQPWTGGYDFHAPIDPVDPTIMAGYDGFLPTANNEMNTGPFAVEPWAGGYDFNAPMDPIDPTTSSALVLGNGMGSTPNDVLGMMPDLSSSQAFGDEAYSDLQLASSASMFHPATGHWTEWRA